MDLEAIESAAVQVGTTLRPRGRAHAQIREGQLRFIRSSMMTSKDGDVIAEARLTEVTYSLPRRFLGDGVKLEMADAGTYYVTTSRNGLFALGFARRWTRLFIDALVESGAKRS